uniref:Uncharacterized protein n=1 Tax=Amphimedon queenslandica TaxID=400682 RepID=A0A1X7U256_AMPQE
MESEHGLSPEQLWITGTAQFHGEITCLQESAESFGVDLDGPLSLESESEADRVEVPCVTNPLQQGDYLELKATVDPTKPCEDFGYTYYMNTLAFVHSKIANAL